MDTLTIILILATFVNGLGAGLCFDVATVKLPTRHRIGVIAYANFARANDLGNGIIVYPIVGVVSALLIFASTILAYFNEQPRLVLISLCISTSAIILAFIGTAKAAPIMLSLRNAPNEEPILKSKLDKFARWHTFRTIFQIITFLALVWALTNK